MAPPLGLSGLLRWSPLIMLATGPALGIAEGTAADYYVPDLPGLPSGVPPVKMHAGHIEVTPEHNGNLFFWHFQNRRIVDRQRTVVWLNGGPGCSSEDGALMEIGPYRVKDDNTLLLNNGSWNEFANLLFVDNPVGTGFSYVDTNSFIHDLDTMANNFVTFLEKFFALFPDYERDDLYFAGESYAGQYIPYIAKAIVERNKGNPAQRWHLQGLLIGNGWISPKEQYDAYIPFAIENGLIKAGSHEVNVLQQDLQTCRKVISAKPGKVDYNQCEEIVSTMLRTLKSGNGDDACVNMYDVRLRDSYPSCGMNWPPDLNAVTSYLRTPQVVSALHVNAQKTTGWQECKSAVGSAFTAKGSKPSVELLPGLLEEVPILLFSGDKDLLCNHIGTEDLIGNMTWNGAQGFGDDAPRRAWTFEGDAAGFWQQARNLTYVLFRESSHMVPVDFPTRSRDMLDRFLGIDVRRTGAVPFDSLIEGEDGHSPAEGDGTTQPAPTNPSDDETQKQVEDAKWSAYQNAGGAVLIIVLIVLGVWGFAVWRGRRKTSAYEALSANEAEEARRKRGGPGDLEAGAFDENELDDLHTDTPTHGKYDIGDDSDDEVASRRDEDKPSRS
ncbi:hypothetical protein S40285_01281 [Stachybotrys chlorohalonatus IBT 40285]|uniref:Pheromone-processing carboxypeptidase KEX1 n=1 Tax=Stachybotrys chlorohalonatus (strain IBT 40285) TaxID=1283841 RepID=A0A084QR17_STAC4|nr:hypothetical protein S40285_01281 [Stachybotrys chlorohalonata IBT 40285]